MKKHSETLARGEILKVIAGLPIIGATVAAIGSVAEAADNKAQFKYQDKPGQGGVSHGQREWGVEAAFLSASSVQGYGLPELIIRHPRETILRLKKPSCLRGLETMPRLG
jgi:hypothetical protein